jgi:hypothetical protein
MRGLVRLAGGCVLAGVLVAALLAPFVVGGGYAAGRAVATAASISPASLTGDTPLVTTVTDRDGTPIATIFDQYRLPLADARSRPRSRRRSSRSRTGTSTPSTASTPPPCSARC